MCNSVILSSFVINRYFPKFNVDISKTFLGSIEKGFLVLINLIVYNVEHLGNVVEVVEPSTFEKIRPASQNKLAIAYIEVVE